MHDICYGSYRVVLKSKGGSDVEMYVNARNGAVINDYTYGDCINDFTFEVLEPQDRTSITISGSVPRARL